MDSIKKKMEKLSNETADAESRIAHFEEIKAQNEAEADKFEEQVRLRKIKKMFAMTFSDKRFATSRRRCKQWRAHLTSALRIFSTRSIANSIQ